MTSVPADTEHVRIARLDVEPAGPLRPGIWSDRPHYAAFVDHDVTSVRITAEASDAQVQVRVAGRAVDANGAIDVELPVGRTVAPVELVNAAGEVLRTYQLRLFRRQAVPDWQQRVEEAAFPARDSAGELVFDGHLWLFGGYLPEVVNDVWRSADGVQWEQMPDVPTEGGVNIPNRFVHDGKMWISTTQGELLSSTDGRQWELVNASPPWGDRGISGSVSFKGRMWVLGGIGGDGAHNDVWSSADGVDWRLELEHAPWSPRHIGEGAVVFQDKLWVIGGGLMKLNYHPFRAYRDVWCSADGRNWEQVTDWAPWEGRVWNSCTVYRNRLWLFGGFQSEPEWRNMDDVWYSHDGRDWRQLHTSHIWSARHELSPYVFNDRLWVVAGNTWPLLNDVWSLHVPGFCFLSQPPIEDHVGGLYVYRAQADFNESGRPVRYRLVEAPDWLSVDAERGLVSGRAPDAGDYRVHIEAFDDTGATAQQQYTLHILS